MRWSFSAALVATLLFSPSVGHAGNGLAAIAIGSPATGLAGANQASQDDAFSVFANPAALTNVKFPRFDVEQAVAYAPRFQHSDPLNAGRDTGKPWQPFVGIGGARPAFDGRGTIAIGFAGIGGSGAFFEDLASGLGTRGRLRAGFGIFRLAPGVAYEVAPGVSLGISAGMNFARLDQEIFFDTSTALGGGANFFGSKLKGATAIAPGGRVGATWAVTPAFVAGLAYTPKMALDFKGGELISNQAASNFGKVQYRSAEARGTALPEEYSFSWTYKPAADWAISNRIAWLRWSRAIGRTYSFASNPSGATNTPVLSESLTQNWRDQLVLAFGVEHTVAESTKLRAGYNYGRNPIPKMVTSPLNNAINEHHITLGIGFQYSPGFLVDAAFAYLPRKTVDYTNPFIGIGQGARLKVEQLQFGVQTSMTW